MFDHIPLTLAQAKDAEPKVTDTPVIQNNDKGGKSKDTVAPAKDAAETTGQTGNQTVPPGGQQANPFGGQIIFILLGMFVLMIFFSMRTQKKERKKREALLGGIKKGDRIQTIGGILGSVVEVKEHKVVVKIDENTNTKMTFARTAVQTIFEDKADTEEAQLAKKE